MHSRDLDPLFKTMNKRAVLTYNSSIDLQGDSWELAALLALDGIHGLCVTGEVILDDRLDVQPPGKLDIKLRCYPQVIYPAARMPYANFKRSIQASP